MSEPATSTFKSHAKRMLAWNRFAYKSAEIVYENSRYLGHMRHEGLTRHFFRRGVSAGLRQSVLEWPVPFRAVGDIDLIGWLRSRGVHVDEGGHTFYIPPQPALDRLLPEVVAFYPADAGFKILRDFRHPRDARYLYKHRRSLALLTRLIGAPHDQLAPANYMFSLGIAPRVWDLTCWTTDSVQQSVFVVQHAAGRRPCLGETEAFLATLERLTRETRLRVLIPDWQQNEDFAPPDCNGNVIFATAAGKAQYLDFQNFAIADPAPPAAAWLDSPDADGRGRAVLSGRFVYVFSRDPGPAVRNALSAGAKWVTAWAPVVDPVEASLFLAGVTRFTVVRGTPPPNPDHVACRHQPSVHEADALVYCDGSWHDELTWSGWTQVPRLCLHRH